MNNPEKFSKRQDAASIDELLAIARTELERGGHQELGTEGQLEASPPPEHLQADALQGRVAELSHAERERSREHEFVVGQEERIKSIKQKSKDRGRDQYYELTSYADRLNEGQRQRFRLANETGSNRANIGSSRTSSIAIANERISVTTDRLNRSAATEVWFDNPDGYIKAAGILVDQLAEEMEHATSISYDEWREQQTKNGVVYPGDEAARKAFEAESYDHDFLIREEDEWKRARKEHISKQMELLKDALTGFSEAGFDLGDLETAIKGYHQLGILRTPEIVYQLRTKMLDLRESSNIEDNVLLQKASKQLVELVED